MGNKIVTTLTLFLLCLGPVSAQTVVTPQFFGLTTLSAGTATTPPIPNIGIVRNLDVSSYTLLVWDQINTASGVYTNFGAPGDTVGTLWGWVDTALSKGQTIDFVLSRTPSWTSSNGTISGVPGTSDWDAWVTKVVTAFKGKIKYYEVWNEPNDPASWVGTNAQMLVLAQHAQSIIHSIDSSALVATPTATEQGGATWLNTYLAQSGAPAAADFVTFHSYNGVSSTYASAEAMVAVIQDYKTVANTYGLGSKPFMSTEGSWYNSPNYVNTSPAIANYLAKYMAEHLMNGCVSAIWYALDAGPEFGQLYASGTLNSAGLAYEQMQTWLTGATLTSSGVDGSGTYYLYVTLPSGHPGALVWNSTTSATFSLPGFTSTTTLPGATSTISGSVTANNVPQFATGPGTPPPPTGIVFNSISIAPYTSGSQTIIIH